MCPGPSPAIVQFPQFTQASVNKQRNKQKIPYKQWPNTSNSSVTHTCGAGFPNGSVLLPYRYVMEEQSGSLAPPHKDTNPEPEVPALFPKVLPLSIGSEDLSALNMHAEGLTKISMSPLIHCTTAQHLWRS